MLDKTKKIYRITGRVIDIKTREGLAGLRVEAWDKDLILNDLVGSAVTDASGAFQIRFDDSYFAELFLDRQPDLFFKVFRNDKLVRSTEDSILWNVRTGQAQIIIEVYGAATPQTEPSVDPGQPGLRVYGMVRSQYGDPLDGVTVQAFDKDMRSEQLLGQTVTKAAMDVAKPKA